MQHAPSARLAAEGSTTRVRAREAPRVLWLYGVDHYLVETHPVAGAPRGFWTTAPRQEESAAVPSLSEPCPRRSVSRYRKQTTPARSKRQAICCYRAPLVVKALPLPAAAGRPHPADRAKARGRVARALHGLTGAGAGRGCSRQVATDGSHGRPFPRAGSQAAGHRVGASRKNEVSRGSVPASTTAATRPPARPAAAPAGASHDKPWQATFLF